MNELKRGDVVVIKNNTNSPIMTINSISQNSGILYAKCIWFDKTSNTFHDYIISIDALQLLNKTI